MASVKMRLLTYNILKGGEGREAEIVEVIRAAAPDVVVVPEVRGVERFRRIAAELGMAPAWPRAAAAYRCGWACSAACRSSASARSARGPCGRAA